MSVDSEEILIKSLIGGAAMAVYLANLHNIHDFRSFSVPPELFFAGSGGNHPWNF